ncbi:MAG: glycosyltransferase family 2 protein [Endomicrobiaceae bacterium]
MNNNKVSIIIPCFNAVKYTRQCVRSVLKYSSYDYELILINNGSSDGTKEYFKILKSKNKKEKYNRIKIIQFRENMGVAGALNLGISKSSGKYICYLNNDVIVTKNWLEGLVEACEKDHKNAIVGTLFNAFENKKFVKAVEKNKREIDRVAETVFLMNKNKVKKAKTIHGLCMLIRKDIFSKVGFFNESFYPCFGEDIEFCKRVKKEGYNLVDALSVFVFHYWNKSVRSKEFNKQNNSIEKVMQKHYKNFSIPRKHKI